MHIVCDVNVPGVRVCVCGIKNIQKYMQRDA